MDTSTTFYPLQSYLKFDIVFKKWYKITDTHNIHDQRQHFKPFELEHLLRLQQVNLVLLPL